MGTFKIESLNYLLRAWEESNFVASILHRHFEIEKKKNPSLQPKFFVGSEISQIGGELVRPIENYTDFRKELESGVINIDYNKYLPRVPKDLRGNFKNKEEFACCRSRVQPGVSFPLPLTKWVYSKNVITVSKNVKIRQLELSEENYLDKLPYDQFLINFAETLAIADPADGKEWYVKEMIVFRDADFIFVYPLPPKYDKAMLDDEDVSRWKKIMRKSDKEFAKDYEKVPFIVREGRKYEMQDFWIGIFSLEGDRYWLDKNGSIDIEEKKYGSLSSCLIKIINFIAYSLANASPLERLIDTFDNEIDGDSSKQSSKENAAVKSEVPNIQEETYAWDEVPTGNVQHLKYRNFNGKKILTKSIGSEKAPHFRRAHDHTYHTKDGPVTRWLSRIKVRKDKMNTEKMKGSELAIKD